MPVPDHRSVACGAGAFAAVGLLAAAGGGYGQESWGWAGLATAWVAALAILLWQGGPRGRLEQLFAGGLVAAGLWALLSATWSRSMPSSILDAQRLVVACGGVLAALALCRRQDAVFLRLGVLGAVVLVCGANLVARLRGTGETLGADAVPVGYANGLAILAVVGMLLALDLGRSWRPAWLALPLAGTVLVLSGSVGAQLALVAGLAVAAVVAGGRLRLAGALTLLAGLGVAIVSFSGHFREHYWRVAWEAAQERPVTGSGAGTFAQLWLLGRDTPNSVRDAHSLYLETLAEQGVIGLAILGVALAVPLLAAHRAAPLAVGAYVAFLAHAAVDWDWEQSGVALAALLVGASLLLEARAVTAPVRARIAWAATALALTVASAVTLAGSLAPRLQPWSTEAALSRAEQALAAGDSAAATAEVRDALARDPNEWRLWELLARAGEGAERERARDRARSLNPLGG